MTGSQFHSNGHPIKVLFSEATIAARVEELAQEIAAVDHHQLLVLPVLKGSFIFAADLLRALYRAGLSPEVDFMMLASYRKSTVSSGVVEILRDVSADIAGRDVLLIDDILESGRTLAFAKDLLTARGALSVKSTVLLEKPHKRSVEVCADFVGFECPDQFVVGYGMDMVHACRELPFVGYIADA